jgi:hypothetical protein
MDRASFVVVPEQKIPASGMSGMRYAMKFSHYGNTGAIEGALKNKG